MSKPESPGPLLRLPSVCARTGLSKPEVYRRVRQGTFPKSIKLGTHPGTRAVAWSAAAVDEWIANLMRSQE